MGYAAKVAYTWNYGEYKVTFFHGEDDKNSLDYYVPDDILLTPQKNTAASASFSQKFLKYFYVNGEYAFSLFNTNIYNEEYEAVETNNFINKLFGKHSSNKYVDAISAAVGYQGPIFGVALQYERVSPFYYTLGGYYFTNDTENFTIAPNLKIFKGKLNFSGNFGLQYNNLNNDKMNDTRQMVYSANASFNSGGAWVASASFSNFTTYTKIRPTSYPYYTDDLDSLNFYQISRNVTAMTAYNFGSESLKNSISLTGSYQCANMLSEDKLTSYSDFFSSNISFNQQFVPQTLSWSFYANANYVNASVAETVYFGPGVSLNKAFLKNTLSTSISCAYNVNNVSGKNTGS